MADGHGGNRVRIADGTPGVDGQLPGLWGEGPIWSPDGRYLAYRGDYLTAGDTRPPAVSWNRNVTISDASGERVASFPATAGPSRGRPTPRASLPGSTSTERHTLGIYGLDGVRQALLDVPVRTS